MILSLLAGDLSTGYPSAHVSGRGECIVEVEVRGLRGGAEVHALDGGQVARVGHVRGRVGRRESDCLQASRPHVVDVLGEALDLGHQSTDLLDVAGQLLVHARHCWLLADGHCFLLLRMTSAVPWLRTGW